MSTARIIPMNAIINRVRPLNGDWSAADWSALITNLTTTGANIYGQHAANKAAELQNSYSAAMANIQNAQTQQQKALAEVELAKLQQEAQNIQLQILQQGGGTPPPKKATWWSRQNNIAKGLIIGGGALVIGGGIYLLTRPRTRKRR